MLNFIKTFRADEDGAVTVDWVVLTAAIVGLGIAVLAARSSRGADHDGRRHRHRADRDGNRLIQTRRPDPPGRRGGRAHRRGPFAVPPGPRRGRRRHRKSAPMASQLLPHSAVGRAWAERVACGRRATENGHGRRRVAAPLRDRRGGAVTVDWVVLTAGVSSACWSPGRSSRGAPATRRAWHRRRAGAVIVLTPYGPGPGLAAPAGGCGNEKRVRSGPGGRRRPRRHGGLDGARPVRRAVPGARARSSRRSPRRSRRSRSGRPSGSSPTASASPPRTWARSPTPSRSCPRASSAPRRSCSPRARTSCAW